MPAIFDVPAREEKGLELVELLVEVLDLRRLLLLSPRAVSIAPSLPLYARANAPSVHPPQR